METPRMPSVTFTDDISCRDASKLRTETRRIRREIEPTKRLIRRETVSNLSRDV